MKKLFIISLLLVFTVFFLVGVNVAQNGVGGWDGRTIEEIVGVPAAEIGVEEITDLSKAEIMQVFFAAETPSLGDLNGEYEAQLIQAGILAFALDFMTRKLYGPGAWEGIAFFPFEKDEGTGYNIFQDEEEEAAVNRTREMDTYIDQSVFGEGNALHTVYRPYNSGLVKGLRQELRQINDALFLGVGYMPALAGKINPIPFLLVGPPQRWVGPDEDEQTE
jgi:hypothetical protein